jgi:hypothetical protein
MMARACAWKSDPDVCVLFCQMGGVCYMKSQGETQLSDVTEFTIR